MTRPQFAKGDRVYLPFLDDYYSIDSRDLMSDGYWYGLKDAHGRLCVFGAYEHELTHVEDEMNTITEYLDIPLTQALAQSFGSKLEKLTAQDKLDMAHTLLTQIAHNDNSGENEGVAFIAEAFGVVYPDAPNTDALAAIIDAHNASIEDRLGLAAALCHQLHKGVYADA
jgi:hypothetical protein